MDRKAYKKEQQPDQQQTKPIEREITYSTVKFMTKMISHLSPTMLLLLLGLGCSMTVAAKTATANVDVPFHQGLNDRYAYGGRRHRGRKDRSRSYQESSLRNLRRRHLENDDNGGDGGLTSEEIQLIEQVDACDAATADFFDLVPAVADASDIYSATLITTGDDDGDGGGDGGDGDIDYSDFMSQHNTNQVPDISVGFPEDAEATFRQACEDNGGYWSAVEDELFFCTVAGLSGNLAANAMTSVWVYRMGNCLATIDDCKNLDPVFMLEDVWQEMALDCRLAQDGETLPPVDEDELMNEIQDELNLSDDDVTCLADTETMAVGSDEFSSASGVYGDTMAIDQAEETGDMKLSFPDDAVSTFRSACDSVGGFFSLVVSQDFSCTSGGMTFNVEVNNMGDCLADTPECQNMDPIHLLESIWDSLDLDCEVKDQAGDSGAAGDGDDLNADSVGGDGDDNGNGDDQSEASLPGDDTDGDVGGDDRTETPVPGDDNDEDAGQAGDSDVDGGDDIDGDGISDGDDNEMPTNTTAPGDENDGDSDTENTDEPTKSPGTSSESEVVGMSDRDANCMQASMNLIEGSEKLESAEAQYARAIETNDPTKIGYSSAASQTMMAVCEEEGGYWSATVSDEITCDMNGRMRRISVFNFGNCVAPTDECKAMDPIVLVKGFFWEVMKFRCWKSDENGVESHTTGPSEAPQTGGEGGTQTEGSHHNTSGGEMPTLGAEQSSSATYPQSSNDDLPPVVPAVIALAALVLVGLGVFYWRRQSTGQERAPSRRAYEMTDISDLRFDSLQFD